MEQLNQILINATSAIDNPYFLLPIDGGGAVYRERVYCYELYHQMRLRWPLESPYFLNGEIDKAAHPILRALRSDHIKPDLLVHQPGNMAGNHTVIEIKSSRAQVSGIKKDLRSLSALVDRANYRRAIYIFYGNRCHRCLLQVLRASAEIELQARIELWLHPEPNHPAVHFTTLLPTA